MRWLVVLSLLAAPTASAVAVPVGDVDFFLFRDEEASIYVLTPDAGAAYSVGFWGSSGNYLANGRSWVFEFVDLDGPFELDPSGTITVVTHVGGGSQEAGTAELAWELIVGGAVAASGGAQRVTYVEQSEQTTWTVAAPAAQINNGDSLRVFTTSHLAKGARMDLEPSQLVLPVLVATPSLPQNVTTVFENMTGSLVERSFENHTGTLQLNWTASLGAPANGTIPGAATGNGSANATLAASWNLTAGAANMTIVAPGNETLFQETVNGTGQTVLPFVAGNWTVQWTSTNVTGTLRLEAMAPGVDEDEPAPNGTEGPDAKPADKGTPLPLPAAVLALAAAARSRRSLRVAARRM